MNEPLARAMEDVFLTARFLLTIRVDVGQDAWTVRAPAAAWHRLRAALIDANAERRISSLFTVDRRERDDHAETRSRGKRDRTGYEVRALFNGSALQSPPRLRRERWTHGEPPDAA